MDALGWGARVALYERAEVSPSADVEVSYGKGLVRDGYATLNEDALWF